MPTGLHHCCGSDARHLYRLPDFSPIDAPGIVWSARSCWQRGLPKTLSDHHEAHLHNATPIRQGLHPMDMRHDFSRRYCLPPLERLLEDNREPMTRFDGLQRQCAARSAA